jgi:hypothetical protein
MVKEKQVCIDNAKAIELLILYKKCNSNLNVYLNEYCLSKALEWAKTMNK